METNEKNGTKCNLFLRFVAYYKPHKATFALDMLASLVFSLCGLFYPILSRQLLNVSVPEKRINEVIIFGLVLLVVYIIRAAMNYYIS